LTIFSAGILATIGFFLFAKYFQPSSLAKLLPSEETLFFGEMKLNEENSKFAELFTGVPASSLLELRDLTQADTSKLLAFAENRVGVAFFGKNVNPQNFALIFDFTERDQILEFFEEQTLEGEELKTQNFLHQKIYYFPSSKNLTFMLVGKNLILASSLEISQKIATAIHSPERRIANSDTFRTVISKQNPRGNSFVLLTPNFLNKFFENRFDGIQKALATPLLNLWQGGGITFSANKNRSSSGIENGLRIKTSLILKDHFVRNSPFFSKAKKINLETLNLFGAETQAFFASNNLNEKIEHFLGASQKTNSTLSTLTKSFLNKIIQKWLGSNFKTRDLAPLFANTSALSSTISDGIAGVFEGEFPTLLEKLKTSNGKLIAKRKLVGLPDTTLAHQLNNTGEVEIKEEFFASQKITSLIFSEYNLNFVQLENFLVFASEKEVLKKMITRFTEEEKIFGELIKESEMEGENIFYGRLEDKETPLLAPFSFFIAGVDFEADGVKTEILLGK